MSADKRIHVRTLRAARRLIVAVVGGTVVLCGLAMLVLPGPALLVTPLGLVILASEFAWARRLLRKVRDRVSQSPPDPPAADSPR